MSLAVVLFACVHELPHDYCATDPIDLTVTTTNAVGTAADATAGAANAAADATKNAAGAAADATKDAATATVNKAVEAVRTAKP